MIRISLALALLLLVAPLTDQPAWARAEKSGAKPRSVQVIRISDKDKDKDDNGNDIDVDRDDEDSDTQTWLGVQIQDLNDDLREALDFDDDLDGVLVSHVVSRSPADKAGIEDRDVITSIDGKDVDEADELSEAIRSHDPGDKVHLKIRRPSEKGEISKEVTLGKSDMDHDRVFRMRMPGSGSWNMFDAHPGRSGSHSHSHTYSWNDGSNDGNNLVFASGSRARLGVMIQELNDGLNEYFNVPGGDGALVTEVVEDSPAEKAGIKAGDVIVSVDEKKVEDTGDLRRLVGKHDPGDSVKLGVYRKGKETEFTVEVEEDPAGFAFGPGMLDLKDIHRGVGRMKLPKLSPEDDARLQKEIRELREEIDHLKEEMKGLSKGR